MSWVWEKIYLVALVLLTAQAPRLECCLEEERLGLLQIKAYMKSHCADQQTINFNWIHVDDGVHDCCDWVWVKCDKTTGRVINMHLSFVINREVYDDSELIWQFNVTLFLPFRELISLDLSHNTITGLVEGDGSPSLSSLEKLQFLNLKSNYFSFLYQDQLVNMKELQVVDINYNEIEGTVQAFCKLKNLQELKLRGNSFNGSVPSCLSNLTALRILDLGLNELSGELPNIFPNLTSLEYFSMTDNYVEGKLSLSCLANNSNLQHLLLSRNKLEIQTQDSWWKPTFQLQSLGLDSCNVNNIPRFLLKQNNLIDIDLSHNDLVGAFPTWLLNNNSQLRSLYLMNNRLSGTFRFPLHSRYSLDTLGISSNNFQGELQENIGSVFPNMTYLNMSTNHFEGHIPISIVEMRGLRILDLSQNNFSGELPPNLVSLCVKLELLQVSDNHLQGDIIPEHMNLTQLFWLKLSNNNFSGELRDSLLTSAVYLTYLDVSNNRVTGQLPNWIGNLSLGTLSISRNLLNGQIPIEICKVLPQLKYLDLSQNDFIGPIPSCSDFSSLIYMHLHKNRLTGPIPDALSSGRNLAILDIRDNNLSGRIPPWINMLSNLTVLLLGGNNLQGQVPDQICELRGINILDLSRNRLFGELPTCFGIMSFKGGDDIHQYDNLLIYGYTLIESIRYFPYYSIPEEVEFLEKNQYLTYTGGDLVLMSGLDLSCNNLSGFIPPELGDLKQIHSLNLSHNCLSGAIPSSFSNLKQIESLDLSYNKLNGMIPPQIVELTFLAIFNVSYNNLTGRIPETGQFGDFDESNYLGNPGLCGSSVNKSCNPFNALPSSTTKEDEADKGAAIDMTDFFWSFGVSSVIALLTTITVLCINPRLCEAWFDFVYWYFLRRFHFPSFYDV